MKKGKFIVIDGIDGSGKSTVIKAMRSFTEDQGQSSFDLITWCKEHNTLPSFENVKDIDILFTAEPTYAWIGGAMRQEMFLSDKPYSPTDFAHAFSLDRLLLYRRLIIPALAAGKTIIQDRSVSTSIIYQADMKDGLSLKELLELPGNTLAMEHPPDHLILTDIEPKVALSRISGRSKGKQEDVFETIEQLTGFDKRFRSDWFKKLYTDRGSSIHRLDTKVGMKESIQNAQNLIAKLLT